MPKPKRNSQGQAVSKQELGELFTQQTSVILQAVDEGFASQDKRIEGRLAAQDKRIEERFAAQNIKLSATMDKRIDKLEARFMQKLSSLTNTLDHFLKRLIDTEEEFVFMKHDVNRIKAVLREKLGVALD
jgi:hypothetical protein